MRAIPRRRKTSAGGSLVEFIFITLMLVPLFIGASGIGIDLIRTLQTVQLARDAGHMYAKGVDFSQPGNDTILYQLGSSLGLSSTGSSSAALVILSNLIYVDESQCQAVGAWNSVTNMPNGCTNYQKWVFTQRQEFGNTALRNSNLGSPLTSGPTGVTLAAGTGKISQLQYVTQAGDVASFNSINPYQDVSGVISGLPSGQTLYLAEAAGQAWQFKPYFGNAETYSFGLF
jgi:hypothetical protein